MATMTFSQALTQAKQEHQTKVTQVPGRYAVLKAAWSCSCGKGSPSRLDMPTWSQAQSYAQRHVEAVARKILADDLVQEALAESEESNQITVKVTVVHTLTLPAAEWASISQVTGTPRQIRDHFDIHHPEAAIEKTVADGTSKVVLFHAEEA